MAMSAKDFQNRLSEISEHEGVAFGRVNIILEAEGRHGMECLQFNGYLHLSDAFKCFFMETAELLNTEIRPKIKTPLSDTYPLFVTWLTHSFQSLCAAERISLNGYPHHGYTLLRNTFDNLLMTSAALQRVTDFYSIEGIEPGVPIDPAQIDPVQIKRNRKKTEWETADLMKGAKSGLSPETIAELNEWDAMFDYETHGARFSRAANMGWMRGVETLPIVPKFSEQSFALFANRYCEIAWMAHRLIPLIQPAQATFSGAWKEKWQTIDQSFEITVNSLHEELGKKIGKAMVELVTTKFPFNAATTFPL